MKFLAESQTRILEVGTPGRIPKGNSGMNLLWELLGVSQERNSGGIFRVTPARIRRGNSGKIHQECSEESLEEYSIYLVEFRKAIPGRIPRGNYYRNYFEVVQINTTNAPMKNVPKIKNSANK